MQTKNGQFPKEEKIQAVLSTFRKAFRLLHIFIYEAKDFSETDILKALKTLELLLSSLARQLTSTRIKGLQQTRKTK